MKQKHVLFPLMALSLLLCIVPLYALDKYYAPGSHPDEIADESGRRQMCTDCHQTAKDTIVFERFNHNVYFTDKHGYQARQNTMVCNMCHDQSFCNECHVTRVELKPSIKAQTENRRRMIHRGDYLTRHQIDGRINPVPCFRCHGNPRSSKECVRCHG